jgi:hypothetical protein
MSMVELGESIPAVLTVLLKEPAVDVEEEEVVAPNMKGADTIGTVTGTVLEAPKVKEGWTDTEVAAVEPNEKDGVTRVSVLVVAAGAPKVKVPGALAALLEGTEPKEKAGVVVDVEEEEEAPNINGATLEAEVEGIVPLAAELGLGLGLAMYMLVIGYGEDKEKEPNSSPDPNSNPNSNPNLVVAVVAVVEGIEVTKAAGTANPANIGTVLVEDEPPDKPVVTPADKPPDKLVDPADKPPDKPVDKPVDTTTAGVTLSYKNSRCPI